MQFLTLVRSQYLSPTARSEWMVRAHGALQVGLAGSYLLLTIVPTLVALGLDKSLGPIDSGEYVVLIVRNGGVIAWQVCALSGYVFMLRQVTTITSSVHSSDQPVAQQGGPPVKSAQNVLSFLRLNVRSNALKNGVALITYTLFSIPPAWPYNAFSIALAVILLMQTMSPAAVLNQANSAALGASPALSGSTDAANPGRVGAATAGGANALDPAQSQVSPTAFGSGTFRLQASAATDA